MDEPGTEPEPTTGMPRWVKVFLVVAGLLIGALVVTLLAGVEHGPGLHGP
jgi:hypothetical protein